MRRQCQEILPGVLLGPLQASKSLDMLRELKITHMCAARPPAPSPCPALTADARRVCIRDAKEAFSVRPRFPDQFTYMVLDVEDSEEQNLIRLFPQCVRPHLCPLCYTAELQLRLERMHL